MKNTKTFNFYGARIPAGTFPSFTISKPKEKTFTIVASFLSDPISTLKAETKQDAVDLFILLKGLEEQHISKLKVIEWGEELFQSLKYCWLI